MNIGFKGIYHTYTINFSPDIKLEEYDEIAKKTIVETNKIGEKLVKYEKQQEIDPVYENFNDPYIGESMHSDNTHKVPKHGCLGMESLEGEETYHYKAVLVTGEDYNRLVVPLKNLTNLYVELEQEKQNTKSKQTKREVEELQNKLLESQSTIEKCAQYYLAKHKKDRLPEHIINEAASIDYVEKGPALQQKAKAQIVKFKAKA